MEVEGDSRAPLDEEGFVQAFPIQDKESILAFWNRFGFVVVKEIASKVREIHPLTFKGNHGGYFGRDLEPDYSPIEYHFSFFFES